MHTEVKRRRHVTLQVLWEEYVERPGEGAYRRSADCDAVPVKVVVACLMQRTEFYEGFGRGPDHCVTLGIEGADCDRIRVSNVPHPARRGSCSGVPVERMASLRDGAIFTGMSLDN